MVPDSQPPTVAFTVLAQLRGPLANEIEMGTVLFTKAAKKGPLTSTLYSN